MSDCPEKIAVDAEGNTYVVGYFNDTAFFGETILRDTDVATMFILKLRPDGKMIWVKQGAPRAGSCDIAVDGDNYVYVLTSNDTAVVKYDKNGMEIWKVPAGDLNNANMIGSDLYIDKNGDIIIVSHSFIAKFNKAGVKQWLKKVNFALDFFMDMDKNNNIYIGNYLLKDTVLLGKEFKVAGSSDLMFYKFNPNAELEWVKHGESAKLPGYSSELFSARVNGVSVDSLDNAYFICSWDDSIKIENYHGFDNGQFVAKYNKAGDLIYLKPFNFGDGQVNNSFAKNNDIYIAGTYQNLNVSNTIKMSSSLYGDFFFMKMDENFNPILVQTIQSNYYSECYDLAVDDHQNIFLSGVFTDSLFLDTHSLKSKGSFDILIAKLREDTSVSAVKPHTLHEVSGENCHIAYNRRQRSLLVKILAPHNSQYTCDLYNLNGKRITSFITNTNDNRLFIPAGTILSNGLYLITLKDKNSRKPLFNNTILFY